jgi:hypothetical protein
MTDRDPLERLIGIVGIAHASAKRRVVTVKAATCRASLFETTICASKLRQRFHLDALRRNVGRELRRRAACGDTILPIERVCRVNRFFDRQNL